MTDKNVEVKTSNKHFRKRLRSPLVTEFDWIVEQTSIFELRDGRSRRECEERAARVVADFLLSPDPWRNICLVVELDGKPVGAGIVMGKDARKAELTAFFVQRVARDMEIEDYLLNACMDFAIGPQCESLSCKTTVLSRFDKPYLMRFGFREQDSGREWRIQL